MNLLAEDTVKELSRVVKKNANHRKLNAKVAGMQIRCSDDDEYRPLQHTMAYVIGQYSFKVGRASYHLDKGEEDEEDEEDAPANEAGTRQMAPDKLKERTASFFARIWSILGRNIFGQERKSKSQVPSNAAEVNSVEDMTRAAEEAQMMKRDYVGILRGCMELEEAVEVKHQAGSPLHRTWLEVLNRSLLLDPSSDLPAVHMAVGEATQ